jgi:hypothetical protein
MAATEEGLLCVDLPERLDRKLRLGPFASARDALKFLCYASAGALLVPVAGVPWGLGIVAFGFLATVWRPDGQACDERVLAALRWKCRSRPREVPMSGRSGRPLLRSGFVRLSQGQYVVVVRTGGTPMAYLPPAELARRFEMFRDLLRATEGRVAYLSTVVTIHVRPFVPGSADPAEADQRARAGYEELVHLLCRRRRGRRVYFALGSAEAGQDSIARLEAQAATLVERLSALGLHPIRLTDSALLEATRRFGWTGDGPQP